MSLPTASETEATRCIGALYDSHWDRRYVPAKLRSDPLYQAVWRELADSAWPLLDLGCGLGLLALYLRAHGCGFPVHGLDYDARKVAAARRAVERAGLAGLRFEHHDLRRGLPEHRGNVTILDILQFFTAEQQAALLREAVRCVAPGGKLIVRSGLRDRSWRFRLTVAGDWLAKATWWMKAAPTCYPSAAFFREILAPHGPAEIVPLHGRTPFNNHLIVLRRGA